MRTIVFILCLVTTWYSFGQSTLERPKLVVGIVVDQMRQEYLYRYSGNFGKGGFNRLTGEGFVLKNGHYNYAPTVTGPGHASVYSGTTPAIHGIIGNEWYDKALNHDVNCVNDPNQSVVGSAQGKGEVSPWRMLTTTVTDELRLATQQRAKVISLSIKDRGAVLPGGHMPNGAFWYDGRSGTFVTSTYYMKELPSWAQKFNALNLADQYLSRTWAPVLPLDKYVNSGPDESPYEGRFSGKDKAAFPYNLKELRARNGNFELLVNVPFSNDFLTEFAKAALTGESLGQGNETDFLCVSYSTPDILGHAVGPNAVELEDLYIRLDRNIEDLLQTLDTKVGKGNYLVFLTADHAVADVAQYWKDNKVPAGYFNAANAKASLNDYLRKYFPERDLIEEVDGHQVFFNPAAFQNDPQTSGVEMMVATELATNYLLQQDGIANVFSEDVLRNANYDEGGIKGMFVRGFHPKRSGDLVIALESGWYGAGRVQGTTHGSPYTYDTHVPIIFFGKGIKAGSSVQYHRITDIAPTLSILLNIKFPSGCTGQPVAELFEE